jgi:preprotein translocase subunit YajC
MNHIWVIAAFAQDDEAGTELTSDQSQSTTDETVVIESTTDDGSKTPPPPAPNLWKQLPFFALIFIVMYMLLFRGPKKKQQEHKKMVASIQKNARVRTIGGILGTVINVKEDEITVKIDESNNTKITIIPGAIAAVLSDEIK